MNLPDSAINFLSTAEIDVADGGKVTFRITGDPVYSQSFEIIFRTLISGVWEETTFDRLSIEKARYLRDFLVFALDGRSE